MPRLDTPEETCKVNRYVDIALEDDIDVLLDLDEVEFWEDVCTCPACTSVVPADIAADPDFVDIAA